MSHTIRERQKVRPLLGPKILEDFGRLRTIVLLQRQHQYR